MAEKRWVRREAFEDSHLHRLVGGGTSDGGEYRVP